VCCIERQNDVDLELELSFTCDFRPQWPAGLGGQIARADPATGAYVLTEELGRFATLIGVDGARLDWPGSDHALPGEPLRTRLCLPAQRGEAEPIVWIAAGAELEPQPLSEAARVGLGQSATGFARAEEVVARARELWRELAQGWRAEREALEGHWTAHQARTARFTSEDALHVAAFEWSKIAIERAWVRVDGLGRGLVAGIGPSRGGARPGYAWFFDGDAMVASRSLSACGDFAGAREVLRFAAAHQRADGKLMHELVLSARLCDWLGDFPYAYYKAPNAPDFVAALAWYVRWSGDVELAWELLRSAERALEWCASTCDEHGRMSNRRAGLAAVEAGPLSERIASEIFLHGAWLSALAGGLYLAEVLGRSALAERYRGLLARARSGLESFWSEERGRYGFAHLVDGGRCDDLSAYLGLALTCVGLDAARARATAAALNHPSVACDWGVRMFATDASVYDPQSYNAGAVFPYLAGFVLRAQFAAGLGEHARQLLESQVALWGFRAPGLIEEHLGGDRALVPERGVPHQIFSSATIVEGTLAGALGLLPDAPRGVLELAPTLSRLEPARGVEGLRVGATTLDLAFSMQGDGRRTLHSCTLVKRAGPPLEVRFTPRLPALSCILRAPPAAQRLEGELVLTLEVEEGPSARFPCAPVLGATSQAARIADVQHGAGRVEWMLWGRAGSVARPRFECDRRLAIRGAQREADRLRVTFPQGPSDAFLPTTVEMTLEP
jgi:hypothetical protein